MKYIINLIWSNKMWIFSEAFHSQVWHEYNWNYDRPFKFDPKFYQKMLILSKVAKDAMDRIHPKVAKDAPTSYPPYIWERAIHWTVSQDPTVIKPVTFSLSHLACCHLFTVTFILLYSHVPCWVGRWILN